MTCIYFGVGGSSPTGDHVFSVVGLYRVMRKVRVSVNYDFMDFLLRKVGFTAYSE